MIKYYISALRYVIFHSQIISKLLTLGSRELQSVQFVSTKQAVSSNCLNAKHVKTTGQFVMNNVHNNGTHCSIISVIKKGYEILKRFIIKKPIESDDDGIIPVVPDISHGRTNFSSQLINCIDNQQSDDDSQMKSNMEIGWKNERSNRGRIKNI
ncbi:hypothetical protein X798_00878 [Onchocerca flexuosa]|uniref:Uncharacterized protein n=1 Tax=Onchocerca flexuosa TaxID=387005 RepID=A0A238C582_9BILA|nr:hypothetical protein X798_00878 [Onchocerca flexuosa]